MTDTATNTTPATFATRQPDTRAVPLDKLKNRDLVGADSMPQAEPRTTVPAAQFNASL